MTDRLSDDQIREFFFNGVLHLPAFYSPAEVRVLQEAAERLQQTAHHYPAVVAKRKTDTGLPVRVENFIDVAPVFAGLVPRLSAVVAQLFGDSAPSHLYKAKINYKHPGGVGYAPHFDGPSVALPGFARDFITVQIAIDDQTAANGCLQGVWPVHQCPDPPESALVPPVVDGHPDLEGRAGAILDSVAAELPWQDLPSAAGSILLFNYWFPHQSGQNRSDGMRRTAYYLFNPADQGDQYARHAAHAAALRAKHCAAELQAEEDLKADYAALAAAGVGFVAPT